MMSRRKVVLYNPRAVFYTMPLALLSVASYLNDEEFEVIIIDGRTEKDPEAKILSAIKGALCFGTSVLTGAPILDALNISTLVKKNAPEVPVVWGGWHPSLFPVETLEDPAVDFVVRGQGEVTFAQLAERLRDGGGLGNIDGLSYKDGAEIKENKDRVMVSMNDFPALRYDLIDFNAYRKLSGRNQLDYISSQGCRFRCTFCADPFVYKRGWHAYTPERMGEELQSLQKQYGFGHVHFQDETFFTSTRRVSEIAGEFLRRKTAFSWFGTMRADQGSRLDEDILRDCARSGLNKVMIGVESGSQRMLDWMKKDIKVGQIFESAEKCRRNNIAISFSTIIGFPGETREDVLETLKVIRELRKMSPNFFASIFYFKPYPGNEIADQLASQNFRFPRGLREWAKFDYVGDKTAEWLDRDQLRMIEGFRFYQRVAWSKPSLLRLPLQQLAKWRCNTHKYGFAVEKGIYERLFPEQALS